MGRGKAKLEWIENNSTRRASFRNRKASLIKKLSELSILCGVDACAIINGPCDPKPEVWPSPKEAQRVMNRFKTMPEMEKSQKMMNQESYLEQRIAKVKEKLKKQQFANREMEITDLMHQTLTGKGLEDVRIEELADLAWVIDQKMKKIQGRIVDLRRTMSTPQPIAGVAIEAEMDAAQRQSLFMEGMNPPAGQQPPPPPPPSPLNYGYYGGDAIEAEMDTVQRQSLFMEGMNPPAEQQPPPPPPSLLNYGYYGGDGSVMPPYGDNFPGSNGFYP
ncbi:hypothetical protein AQUCO_01600296v1 [Aquilegia coerulea]|uniref:MADS-box domain-containing protein n=1 Tax=Aquilegia coerulea TaxID=218851 RepID=A0A2G5DQZ4_AQUCA|nr:hypothetical protein AQUCO_01600296v1 [Aquilegia coerulea]